MLAQLRTATHISPLDCGPPGQGGAAAGTRAARWPAIQKALEGLRLRPEGVARVRQALLALPGPLLPALDRTSA